jgi:hypothetical protein
MLQQQKVQELRLAMQAWAHGMQAAALGRPRRTSCWRRKVLAAAYSGGGGARVQGEKGATAAAFVRGCEGRGRVGARGNSRAGYVGSRDAMQRLGLRENL